jgi:GNAT superfamily N-acetyltransferase
MLTIRTADHLNDSTTIKEHNLAMALETEGKVLDKQAAELGVKGLFDRPQFGFYLLANIDEKPVASLMVTYEWSDWRNGVFWWIQSVYVKTEFRRQGIYAAMYSELKKMASESRAPVCGFRLYAETQNSKAHATYMSSGMNACSYLMFEETND